MGILSRQTNESSHPLRSSTMSPLRTTSSNLAGAISASPLPMSRANSPRVSALVNQQHSSMSQSQSPSCPTSMLRLAISGAVSQNMQSAMAGSSASHYNQTTFAQQISSRLSDIQGSPASASFANSTPRSAFGSV